MICIHKNSENQCIPYGCFTGNWFECGSIECPLNNKHISEDYYAQKTMENTKKQRDLNYNNRRFKTKYNSIF
jgi:hypothetical protein